MPCKPSKASSAVERQVKSSNWLQTAQHMLKLSFKPLQPCLRQPSDMTHPDIPTTLTPTIPAEQALQHLICDMRGNIAHIQVARVAARRTTTVPEAPHSSSSSSSQWSTAGISRQPLVNRHFLSQVTPRSHPGHTQQSGPTPGSSVHAAAYDDVLPASQD
jgi:hypothetical protein